MPRITFERDPSVTARTTNRPIPKACPNGHKFTPENVYVRTNGRIECRKCMDAYRERSRQKRKTAKATERAAIRRSKRPNVPATHSPKLSESRQMIVDVLQTGPFTDPTGFATAKLHTTLVEKGLAGISKGGLVHLLSDMAKDGQVTREVNGKRTYSISLSDSLSEPRTKLTKQDQAKIDALLSRGSDPDPAMMEPDGDVATMTDSGDWRSALENVTDDEVGDVEDDAGGELDDMAFALLRQVSKILVEGEGSSERENELQAEIKAYVKENEKLEASNKVLHDLVGGLTEQLRVRDAQLTEAKQKLASQSTVRKSKLDPQAAAVVAKAIGAVRARSGR